MEESDTNPLSQTIKVLQEAERLIGRRAWFLLTGYGKLMSGPRSGNYVSGIPDDEQLELVRRLASGDTVSVHLMHRHKSGCCERSKLKLSPNGMVMVFEDRDELA